LKALAINLGIWAIMAGVGMAIIYGARVLGHELPRWLFLVAMAPIVLGLMSYMWRAYTTPVVLSSAGLTLGRGEQQKFLPWSTIRETNLQADGVELGLVSGETLRLSTQADPNLPDPLKDVLFGAIVAARQ
jgi:hypothetical protein